MLGALRGAVRRCAAPAIAMSFAAHAASQRQAALAMPKRSAFKAGMTGFEDYDDEAGLDDTLERTNFGQRTTPSFQPGQRQHA